jgi:hypothetical protein
MDLAPSREASPSALAFHTSTTTCSPVRNRRDEGPDDLESGLRPAAAASDLSPRLTYPPENPWPGVIGPPEEKGRPA